VLPKAAPEREDSRMEKHTLFFVHGIGQHDAGWAAQAQQQLQACWDAIDSCRAQAAAQDAFEIVPLGYDAIFEGIRKRWREDLNQVLGALGEFDPPQDAVAGIVQLWQQTDDDSFLTTHVLDLILYMLVPQLRHRVCVHVFKQLRDRLVPATGPMPLWSIFGHSMGTSVVHDTLQGAVMQHWEAYAGPLPPGTITPYIVGMLANCSRVLERKPPPDHTGPWPWDVFSSNVWPGRLDTRAMCHYYLNVVHALDPVPRPKPFTPGPTWPGRAEPGSARRMAPYVEALLEVPTGLNVHTLEHHLADPDCYVPLFRLLGGMKAVSTDQWAALRSEHRKKHLAEAAVADLRQRLALAGIDRFKDIIDWGRKLLPFV
jgi:hypothetical protein